ncbi:MAG: hypothetical protein J5761_05145, partial [Paludibacteraceae bacterium]|nr:hypothetical protein [Paludibacteraceae bacterium]
GTQTIALTNVSGQYIRLVGHARSSGYGISLWEIEVYGSGPCEPVQTGMEEIYGERANSYKFIQNGRLYIRHNGVSYTATGLRVQ